MPSAQSKKEPFAALFLCAAARLAVWKYGGGRLPRDLHPNPQPSAKRDIAAPRRVGLCLRRRAKKSRSRLFFFARQPALPYGNTAAADFRTICIRIRSPRQSGTWQRRDGSGCAFGAEQKRAACGSFSLRENPPHTRRNTSSAETSSAPSPAGEGLVRLRKYNSCKATEAVKTLHTA